jgi:hypothetical protein
LDTAFSYEKAYETILTLNLTKQALRALREGLNEDPRLKEMPAEEVARQLVLGGHLEGEPPPPLVAEALEGLEGEEQSLQNDELSSEDANPT